jgi:hypothetical protein
VSRERLRGASFAALALAVALAPAANQVLGVGKGLLLRSWRMFAGPGVGFVDARFALRLPDGSEQPLDRYAVLGLEPPRSAPSGVRRPRGKDEFQALVRRLCERLGPGADLRAQARVAARYGWRTVDLGGRNLCGAPPDAGAAS